MNRFDIYMPCKQLQPYVQQFAISETNESGTYKVLPGTGMVIGFQYKGRLSRWQSDELQLLDRSGLSGLHDRYLAFANTADTGTVLIYFKDAAIGSFFRQPAHELFAQSVSLDQFMLRSELLVLEEQLAVATDDGLRIKIVAAFLLSRLQPVTPDPLIQAALDLIWRSNGSLRIHDLAVQLHSSKSPLEKRFRNQVGTSPKKFAALVRFQYILRHYKTPAPLTAMAYDAGFYDQAHFIRTFRDFTGETPEIFFKGGLK